MNGDTPVYWMGLPVVDYRISHMDASSCYCKLEGLPVAFTVKPTPKEKLALATSGFRLARGTLVPRPVFVPTRRMESPAGGFQLGGEFAGSRITGNLLSLMTMNDSEANDVRSQ